MLARGGGESARAKGGGWEKVVEDGEVVVGWPMMMCAGSGKPGKKRRRRTRRCVHTKQTRTSEEGLVISPTPSCAYTSSSHFMKPTGSKMRPVTAQQLVH